MKICILGMGKMGSWLAMALAGRHRLAVFDTDRSKADAFPGFSILTGHGQLRDFTPDMLINAVSLQNTVESYRAAIPHLPAGCLLCDVASIKGDLHRFYCGAGLRFVSLHPMFGPTFANIRDLRQENAVIISESDPEGKEFFRLFFTGLGVNVCEFSFAEHDEMMSYSLALPFVSSLVFSSCVNDRTVPGTTFKKHLEVARGLLGEDDILLSEIIFNPHSLGQLEKITGRLNFLWHIIKDRDEGEARRFFSTLRENMGMVSPSPSAED